jgi:hypothetical protein
MVLYVVAFALPEYMVLDHELSPRKKFDAEGVPVAEMLLIGREILLEVYVAICVTVACLVTLACVKGTSSAPDSGVVAAGSSDILTEDIIKPQQRWCAPGTGGNEKLALYKNYFP